MASNITKLCCVLNPYLECEACGDKICVQEQDRKGKWFTWKLHDHHEGLHKGELVYWCPIAQVNVVQDHSVKHLRFKRI